MSPSESQAAAEAPVERTPFGRAVLDALRGVSRDYTQGSLTEALWLLAVPMVLEMVMESIFAVVDVFVVGRVGPDAVATVGLTESLLTVLYALAMGLSIGAMALVARRIGEKDPETASRTAAQALFLGIAVSVPVAISGALLGRSLLAGMGGSGWVLEHGQLYTRVMLGGCTSITLLFLLNAIFRGSGDPAVAMRTLWLANGINIVLGPCLVLGLGPFPKLGVVGAAVATTTGRSIGVLYQLTQLFFGKRRVRLAARHLVPDGKAMWSMVKLSGAGVLQTLIGMASWVVLVRIVASFGTAAVAGWTVAMRLVMFALLPSFGMANAAATLVGQSLGAKKPERAEAAVWKAGVNNVAFLGVIAVVFIVLAPKIVVAFTSDPEAMPIGVHALRIVASGFLFYAFGMVLGQAFNGAGDTLTPTLLNLVCFWVLELPLAWVLSHVVGLRENGAFISVAVAFSVMAAASAWLFRRGRWKTKVV